MASRFDRLVLLLNTGSTAAVRSTAAQQLGEIQKQHPGELNNLLSRVLVHLRSKQWETRIAAGQAIYAIASNVPQWDPASTVKSEDGEQESKETDGQGWLSFENFDIGNVLEHGKTLLGSAGKEYDVEWGSMTPEERLALQKKNLRQRLGIGSQFMEDDLLDDSDLSGIALSNTKTTSPVVKEKSPSPIHDSKESLEISEGLSARERNRLKRKAKKDAKDKGKDKVRVMDLSHRRKTDPSSVPTAVKVEEESKPIDGKGFLVTEQPCSDRVVIESILPSSNAEADVEWPFEAICEVLCMDLFDPVWEVRHGAGIGLREVIKVHGAGAGKIVGITENANEARHNDWLADCAVRLLCVFALDRFGDFVSDQVIAPVRETCAQTIGALLQYMPPNLVLQTQRVLLRLIMQTDTQLPDSKRVVGDIWEVRHAGMLGLKYAVAVRKDLVEQMLEGTVDAVVLGLKDNDDDVRAVSASTLLPITDSFVNHLPDRIPAIVSVLWDCLKDLKDDLTSSTASVMDLLAKLFSSTAVLRYMHKAAKDDESHSLECLMPRLYPFFRHTITSVRVAVLNTLYTFIEMDLGEGQADAGWIDEACLRLVYQNMIVEEKQDIVNLSLKVWTSICKRLEVTRERISAMATPQLQHWFTILMTPLGTPLDTRLFYSATAVSDSVNGGRNRKAQQGQTRHNLDAGMISQDFALVSPEAVLRGRVAAATALGRMMSVWQSETQEPVFKERLEKCLGSPCALNRQLIGVLLEEWAVSARSRDPNMVELAECNSLASDLCSICCTILESDGPTVFSELNAILGRIRIECQGLLNCFVAEGGVPAETIPSLPPTIGKENVGSSPGTADGAQFTVEIAGKVATETFDKLLARISSKKKRVAVTPQLEDCKRRILASVGYYQATKDKADVSIQASIAAAVVAIGALPTKLNPVIRSSMNAIKYEENLDLQKRSAVTLTRLISLCAKGATRANPSGKIIKNLCTFLCADPSVTPVLATNGTNEGILSLNSLTINDGSQRSNSASAIAASAAVADIDVITAKQIEPVVDEDQNAKEARLVRRGAHLTLCEIVSSFKEDAFKSLPVLWECMTSAVLDVFGSEQENTAWTTQEGRGQQVVDALQIIGALASSIHPGLNNDLASLLPFIAKALLVNVAVVRNMAARTLAILCKVVTIQAMDVVINKVVGYLGDVKSVVHRQGAAEAIFHIVNQMESDILPYVIFLIVPILGRMSDTDESVRIVATNCFAMLIKLVPLEAGIPDAPGMPPEMLALRDKERQFLAQLLDSKKLEPFQIPVKINAELRKYQQEGVNWMAFLNKYQLHGILCDDMGLGKTLQSICILASDHYLRAQKFKATQLPDSAPLPSLVVCPPTLTGHWQHEIENYTDVLKPMCYSGGPQERRMLRSEISQYDVVIISYEILRNDIEELKKVDWDYCILDEGHIIKNAKTKITKAVKSIKANHRLILSGMPIQNNVLELWSLFDFLMPGFLGTEKMFNERIGKPIFASRNSKSSSKDQEAGALALEALHKQVLPFLLRRLKEDVLHDLPPKIIQDYHCELSNIQKQIYDTFAQSQVKKVIDGEIVMLDDSESFDGKEKKATHIFQALQYLRKLCNHPLLVLNPKHPQYAKVMGQIKAEKGDIHDLAYAPKLKALKQLLLDCGIGVAADTADGGNTVSTETVSQHRVLIFCQLKTMLDIIKQDLFQRHMPTVTYMRLDGGVDVSKRHGIVQKFNSDPSIDVLLLTTHVGGLGLNLTGADTVIFFEHDWNPMKDLQAMDRAHRIGQKKVVNVYRLITKGTLEDKIMGLQKFKLNIANTVINQQNTGLQTMDTDQILDLFTVSTQTDTDSKKKRAEDGKKTTAKAVLENLEALCDEKEYEEEYNLDGFIDSLKR